MCGRPCVAVSSDRTAPRLPTPLPPYTAASLLSSSRLIGPAPRVASMNGVVVEAQAPLSFAREADAVIVGSGVNTREVVKDAGLMAELKLATWVISRLAGWKAAEAVVHYVAPVGEKADYVARMRSACSESLQSLKTT